MRLVRASRRGPVWLTSRRACRSVWRRTEGAVAGPLLGHGRGGGGGGVWDIVVVEPFFSLGWGGGVRGKCYGTSFSSSHCLRVRGAGACVCGGRGCGGGDGEGLSEWV